MIVLLLILNIFCHLSTVYKSNLGSLGFIFYAICCSKLFDYTLI